MQCSYPFCSFWTCPITKSSRSSHSVACQVCLFWYGPLGAGPMPAVCSPAMLAGLQVLKASQNNISQLVPLSGCSSLRVCTTPAIHHHQTPRSQPSHAYLSILPPNPGSSQLCLVTSNMSPTNDRLCQLETLCMGIAGALAAT